MANLECAGHTLAIGLQWNFVDSEKDARQRVRQAEQTGSGPQPEHDSAGAGAGASRKQTVRYVQAPGEDGLMLGLEIDAQTVALSGRGKRYAGGLLAAQLLRDAIVFETLAPERVWVCAVSKGQPLPEKDLVTTPQVANQVMLEVRSYAQTHVDLVGNHPEATMTLAAMLEQMEPDMLRASRMKRPTDPTRIGFYSVLLLACGLATWSLLRSPEVAQDQIAQPSLPQLLGPSDDEIRRGDAKLLTQAMENLLRRPDARQVTAAWRALVRDLPYGVGGYRPSQIDCRLEDCRLQWDWRSEQFERHHLARLPGERQPSQTPGEYMRRVQTRLPLPSTHERRLDGVLADDLDDWALALITRARRTGARIEIVPPKPVPISLPPLRDKKPRSQIVGHEGRIAAVASGWAAIQALLEMLAHEQLSVERSVYSISGSSISMQLDARYVVLAD